MTPSEKFQREMKKIMEAEYKRALSDAIKRGIAHKKQFQKHENN